MWFLCISACHTLKQIILVWWSQLSFSENGGSETKFHTTLHTALISWTFCHLTCSCRILSLYNSTTPSLRVVYLPVQSGKMATAKGSWAVFDFLCQPPSTFIFWRRAMYLKCSYKQDRAKILPFKLKKKTWWCWWLISVIRTALSMLNPLQGFWGHSFQYMP